MSGAQRASSPVVQPRHQQRFVLFFFKKIRFFVIINFFEIEKIWDFFFKKKSFPPFVINFIFLV